MPLPVGRRAGRGRCRRLRLPHGRVRRRGRRRARHAERVRDARRDGPGSRHGLPLPDRPRGRPVAAAITRGVLAAFAARPPHMARRPGLAAVDVTADDSEPPPDDTAPSPRIEVDRDLAGAPGPAGIPARDPVTTVVAADRLCRLLRVLQGAEGCGEIILAVNGQHDMVVHRGPHGSAPRWPRPVTPGQREQFECR